MKKLLILSIFMSIFSILGFSQEQEESEGIKSLKRKCKEVRKHLEEKYGEEIISHDCDVSVLHGIALESIVSFKSNPDCKSKVITHFTDKFKDIKQVYENMEYERFAYLRKEKALNLLNPIFSSFNNFELTYTPFEIAISLEGEMTPTNKESLSKALEVFAKEENKDLFEDRIHPDSNTVTIPRFYIYVSSKTIDTTAYPLLEMEKNTIPENILKIEKKFNGVKASTKSEYSIYTESEEVKKGNGMNFLQRKVSAYNPENKEYVISVGGFIYLNN